MADKEVGGTGTFVVRYEQSSNPKPTEAQAENAARERLAQVVLWSAEYENERVAEMLNCTPSHFVADKQRVPVRIVAEFPGAGEFGHVKQGGPADAPMSIEIVDFKNHAQHVLEDAARTTFVHELTHIYMQELRDLDHAEPKESWNPGGHEAEAICRVINTELHPLGYYVACVPNTTVNDWFTSTARPDWTNRSDGGPNDRMQFGGLVLLFHYMHHQLGYEWREILYGGPTAEAVFHRLTGRTGGQAEMLKLLDRYFPGHQPLHADNPFPLLEGIDRHVRVTRRPAYMTDHRGTQSKGTVQLSEGCPKGTFAYTIDRQSQWAAFRADVHGFAIPRFTWWINGVIAFDNIGSQVRDINVDAKVLLDDPASPGDYTVTTANVGLRAIGNPASDQFGLAHELSVNNLTYDGRITLSVEVAVTESHTGQGEVRGFSGGYVEAQVVKYERDYYNQLKYCWLNEVRPMFKDPVWPLIFDRAPFEEVVDPPWLMAVMTDDLLRLAADSPEDAAQAARALEQRFGLRFARALGELLNHRD